MQVSAKVDAVSPDPDVEGVWIVTLKVATPAEARAFGARIERESVLEMPDAQPPDVHLVTVPEEEAEVNAPKKGRR